MAVDRVKFQDIVESQFPRYVLEDFPLLPDFIKQYYKSQEYQGGTFDLIQNIDQYVKIDELFALKTSTELEGDLNYISTTIPTSSLTNFTEGFPETNGLIKIDDEIIHYESISNNSFINCTRGFSGITTYITSNEPDTLTFESTSSDTHKDNAIIHNLNIIFLQEFFRKVKSQVAPGFDERVLYDNLDERNFLYNVDSFYKSKGTDSSFKILFRSLYGEEVEVIKPSQFLFRPSDAEYKVTQDFVVEKISGDPLLLKNLTLFQDSNNARGSVSDVNPIDYADGEYYQISIDSGYSRDISVKGSIFGEFKVNPKTKILNNVAVGSTIIDVDSTIGFPYTGNLLIQDDNGDPVSIAYTGKSVNQFLNVSGVDESFNKKGNIRLDDYSYAYVGLDTGSPITVRITSALKEFKLDKNSYFYNKNDTINIQSLGIERGDERSKNWYSNIKTEWDIDNIELIDELEKSYQIDLHDKHFLRPGYQIVLTSNSGLQLPGTVSRSSSEYTFSAKLASNIGSIAYIKVENQTLRGNSGKYPSLNTFIANVQNVYQKFNGDVAVASNSIPNYSNIFTDPYDKKITFSGSAESDFETLVITVNKDHGFLTGDTVFYKPGIIKTTTITPNGIEIVTETESKFNNVDSNVYYVKRINSTSIKLSRSRSDIFSNKYVTLDGTVEDNQIIYYEYYNKKLSPQNIVREVLSTDQKSGNYDTPPGYNGILVNGVEVLNYKSGDGLKYGDLRSIEITNGGEGYDIINPPVLSIVDEFGSGAEGDVSVEGELVALNLIDRGFDYQNTPTVKISGGSPTEEAIADVNMISVQHTLSFNSELTARQIDIGLDTIGFSTFHKLNDTEKVIYDAKDGTPIVGLSTNAYYFVELVDNFTVKLHTTEDNARAGINTVNISSFGTGFQYISSVEKKNVVASIYITNPGKGYKNRERTIPTSGINTAQNCFHIPEHGYSSGEIIKYTTSSGIVGLSTNDQYYVKKRDDDTFSLTLVGSGATDKKYYYNKNILVDFTTSGNGSFNYLPIEVSIEGIIGVTTTSGQNFQCKVQPIFRGSIDSVDLTSNGVSYGSSEIVNFNRQPNISFDSGKNAQLTPIISNGKIVDVVVNDGGSEYNSPPNLIIRGDGSFAKLTPEVNNGVITSVNILSSGAEYVNGSTQIEVQAAGKNSEAEAIIRNWNVNIFERDFNNIEVDDGFIGESIDDTSLEYCHVYSPRSLRSNSYVISGSDDTQYGISDLTLAGGVEKTNSYHSPVLGWAYDGNPIYGPYGFTDPEGGNVSQMVSGYELKDNPSNRPPTSLFPLGYFIEDYIFTDRGSLDEHNGRFCITPDYPNGRYCYFSTLNPFGVDSSGPFKNYKRPAFPYLIGDTFYSKPNVNNYKVSSNQVDYNFENGEWFRNTNDYHTNDDNSGYEYVFNSDKEKNQSLDVIGSSKGSVESIGIVTGGISYKVNDRVILSNHGTGGTNAQGRVDRVFGPNVNYINYDLTTIEYVEFGTTSNLNQFIGFATQTVPFDTHDEVFLSGLSTDFAGYSGTANLRIGIRSDNWLLTLGVGSTAVTGLTTYFYVSGELNYPTLRENNILGIGTEQVKVLNIDTKAKRIRVRRESDGVSTGLAHTSGEVLFEDPRKFTVNVGTLKTTRPLEVNKEIYFYPQEVVGVGTVGVGATSVFNNPGVGVTQKFIPIQQIYLPNHNLDVNERLYYNSQGGTPIGVWNGISATYKNLNTYDFYYTAPINKDFIGISTNKVGMGTQGSFVGVGTSSDLLYITSVPADDYHSFTTDKDGVLTGRISRTTVNVGTSGTHGLAKGDTVYITVKPTDTKTINVSYNDSARRIVFDPRNITTTNTIRNTVIVMGHDFVEGDKVLYTEGTSSITGLDDGDLYYIYPYDTHSLQLVKEKDELSQDRPKVIDILSTGNGYLSKINPPVEIKRNNKLKFDLSDQSLSFVVSGIRYPAYELRLYTDSDYNNAFFTTGTKTTFEVTSTGEAGIDLDADLTLLVSDEVPSNLWYKFVPINNDIITEVKKEIRIDTDVNSNNTINVEKTKYDGIYSVSAGIGTTTFSYNLSDIPDEEYNDTNSVSSYETTSSTAFGPISRVTMLDQGANYEIIPGISTVTTEHGSGSILKPLSTSIGKIQRVKFNSNNIGFDYPTDETLRPVANPPEILEMESLTSFNNIGISSGGRNYLNAPNLVVLDGYTNHVVGGLDLYYHLGDTEVTILQNSTGMYNLTPTIIPINNTNGVGISSLTYTPSTKTVRLYLNSTFSDASAFPYNVGSKIFVENLNVGVNSTGKGYNSENYSYQFFTVTASDSNLGGGPGAYVDYSLIDYLSDSDIPGQLDSANSDGRVIAVDHFPIFNPTLKKNLFFEEEVIIHKGIHDGRVESWDPITEILKVDTSTEYSVGDIVKGLSSEAQGVILSKIDFNAEITTGAGTTITHGWQKNTGFFNDNLQKLPNNEYYQSFSYSIKSKIPYDTWEDPVSSLNHISGYSKFSDLQVISTEDQPLGIAQPFDSDVDTTTNIVGNASLHCFYDFDYVTENNKTINGEIRSDEIYFENRILSDYYQSVGNRVLDIDDFSGSFYSNERPTKFSDIEAYQFNDNYNKIFAFARDRIFTDERQLSIISLLQSDSVGYIQQYATLDTYPDLGYFGYIATAEGWNLQFYPVKFSNNIYDTTTLSICIQDNITSIGNTNLGSVALLDTNRETTPDGTTESIVSIGTSYRAAKLLVLQEDENDNYAVDEFNLVHDGSDVHMLEYGGMQSDSNSYSSVGFGTFDSRIVGNNMVLDYTPNVGSAVTTNTYIVALSDTETGISTITLQESKVNSGYKSISSSGSPSANTILSFQEPYASGYYIVSVKDTTNSQYEMFEVCIIASESNESFVEWANITTGGSIGQVGVTSTGKYTNLTYTPNANANVEVRTYGMEQAIWDGVKGNQEIDLDNVKIYSGNGLYRGTKLDLKSSFDLKHDDLPIFRRQFNGNDASTLDFVNNILYIKEHFFVTGENVTYSYGGEGTTEALGIAATTVTGIGLTDKLPTDLYIVKVGDGSVRFAESAENALKLNPEVFEFSSVGIGTSHHITAKKQNAKALIAIDNMIQAPLSETTVTSTLNDSIVFDSIFPTSGISSFAAADIMRIDDEVMRVVSVGVGGAGNITVLRGQLGTTLSPHGIGSTITKMTGSYNIVGNTINFIQPPYGAIPLSTTSSAPSERDYTGLTTHSTFQGRTFMRTAPVDTDKETYSSNHVFDDISSQFTGIRSEFRLTDQGQNTAGFSTDNAIILINNIFQEPLGDQVNQGTYNITETSSGISSIRFEETGSAYGYDPNRSNLPIGGFIVSIGSTEGGGYQPLVSAGGSAVVSTGGTIQSISIGNSGSGYRSGVQVVNVGVQTSSVGLANIELIGTATISGGNITGVSITNPGSGYTTTNPPEVIFDEPSSYTNIPLIYSGSSVQGIGQSATIDIQVGLGGSIIDYNLKQEGFAYNSGEILTVPVGGATGIPTSGSYSEFQITIDKIFKDTFNGLSVGVLQVLDNFDSQFDGRNKSFRLSINDQSLSIQSSPGSPVEVDKTLLVFINDILQQPEVAYNFTGGGTVVFVEAPEPGDSSKVLFYKGSGDVDVVFTDVLETVKIGDILDIDNNPSIGQGISLDEDMRTVTGINTIDSVSTINYNGPGITQDTSLVRPVNWCKQLSDKIINTQEVGKDRVEYEPLVYPTSYLIQPVGLGSTEAYVDSIRPLFNTYSESNSRDFQNRVKIVSQKTLVGASATAIVSGLGTVSIDVTNVGYGYTIVPTLSISNPSDGTRATGTLTLSGDTVGVVTITNPGSGYTSTNPPLVLIGEPTISREEMDVDSYSGDYGNVVGLGTTSSGAQEQLYFDLYIPVQSFMRDSEYVGTGVTISDISVNDYLTIFNTNVSIADTFASQNTSGATIGIGTTSVDNVYQVVSIQRRDENVTGVGVTAIQRITVNVDKPGTFGFESASEMGNYSWGKILFGGRVSPFTFEFYGTDGISGISTSGLVSRFEPLKYRDYTA